MTARALLAAITAGVLLAQYPMAFVIVGAFALGWYTWKTTR